MNSDQINMKGAFHYAKDNLNQKVLSESMNYVNNLV